MAGNKKPGRKPTPKGIGTGQRAVDLHARGIAARRKRNQKEYERNCRISRLPLGHPVNVYVLDWTFDPIIKMLDDNERTGTHMVDEDGNPMMWVEREQCYTGVVPGLVELAHQFDAAADEFGWGDQPHGLRAYAFKLARGERMTNDDRDDARVTLAWMREKLATITAIDWASLMRKVDSREAA